MNWHAIGAIGQILGSLATFVTVGYLAVQVHDAEKDMKRSIAQSRAERNMEANLALATNERLASIHVKANVAITLGKPYPLSIPPEYAGVDLQEGLKGAPPIVQSAMTKLGLTPEELVMLNSELTARWNNSSHTILYADELLPGDRTQFDQTLRAGFAEPLALWWWEFSKPTFNPDAVRYVDNLLAQPG
jgi:hypothetical protein